MTTAERQPWDTEESIAADHTSGYHATLVKEGCQLCADREDRFEDMARSAAMKLTAR